MNNNRGQAPNRPPKRPQNNAQGRPMPPRPQGGMRRPPMPNQNRPMPQSRPSPIRPPIQKRSRVSSEALLITVIVLSVILAALIITYAIMKAPDKSPDNDPPESTPTEQVGGSVPEDDPLVPQTPSWVFAPTDPKAFVPVTDSSTVKLSASKIYSNQIIMVDSSTGKVVCEYGADTKIYPASMTKIMTVIVACDLIEDMDKTFVLSKELLYTIESGATNAYFIADNPVPMVDLIYGAILPSGADACLGLANALAGSEAEFVKLMNAKAAEIGCTKTNFTNSIGLHDENHYSSVRDVATIMGYAMENPFLRKVMTATSYKTVAPVDRADGTLYASWQQREYTSNKATMIGAKSGYTEQAGRCLASVSKTDDGHEYIIVSAGAFFVEGISATSQSFADVKYLCDTYIK